MKCIFSMREMRRLGRLPRRPDLNCYLRRDLTASAEKMAERVGFEPTVPVRAQRFSRPSQSTTLAPLREILASRRMKVGPADVRGT
jgi:hypothetical protein